MSRTTLASSKELRTTRFMNRLRAVQQALAIGQAREGKSDPDRQGRFVPYAHTAPVLRPGQDEALMHAHATADLRLP